MAKLALGSLLASNPDWNISRIFFRYVLVGLGTNACGYCIYLLVTWLGGSPIASMTILYFIGTLLGFLGNRQWSFRHDGKALPSLIRYCFAYLIGYGLNLSMLYFFVDRFGYPHQFVQAAAIFVVAGYLFLMLNFFVFPRVGMNNHQRS